MTFEEESLFPDEPPRFDLRGKGSKGKLGDGTRTCRICAVEFPDVEGVEGYFSKAGRNTRTGQRINRFDCNVGNGNGCEQLLKRERKLHTELSEAQVIARLLKRLERDESRLKTLMEAIWDTLHIAELLSSRGTSGHRRCPRAGFIWRCLPTGGFMSACLGTTASASCSTFGHHPTRA